MVMCYFLYSFFLIRATMPNCISKYPEFFFFTSLYLRQLLSTWLGFPTQVMYLFVLPYFTNSCLCQKLSHYFQLSNADGKKTQLLLDTLGFSSDNIFILIWKVRGQILLLIRLVEIWNNSTKVNGITLHLHHETELRS